MNDWHLNRSKRWRLLVAITFWMIVSFSAYPHCAAQPPVTALAFAPSGDRIVSGSQGGVSIREWPSLMNAEDHVVDIGKIQDLQFSPDGTRLLIVGGKPSEVGEWRIVTWPNLTTIASSTAHDDVIHSAIWLSENEFVTAAADNEVIQWQVGASQSADGRADVVRRLSGHTRRVLSVESLDNGRLLVSAGVDQSLRVWSDEKDLTTPLRILDNHTDIVRDLARRPGEHSIAYLASASADKTVRLWQPSIGRLVRFARLPVEPLCIAWTTDGNHIGVGCIDGNLRIVNATSVKVEQTLPAIAGWAYTILASPDGSFAVGGSEGTLVRVRPSSPLSP
ncbi:WD domain, G-beta repeat [Rubripirellula tenax]|uniref:WD domain, G-beta repeat n=1 Tax=Rubripirellula tenax TaxID=2528015 RepID=A0A5C6F0V5_9BACT|nr:WD40 repeat domain-containing protein [Rubripirellula tenax]TWU54665.1 WD domain, G-beta repeat [Rubripirellula tenax]